MRAVCKLPLQRISEPELEEMSELSRSNLQEFCRICLGRFPCEDDNNKTTNRYNIFTTFSVPALAEILVALTALDVTEDEDLFPRCVCQLCYEKLLTINEIRVLTLKSAEVLKRIVHNVDQFDGSGNSKYLELDQEKLVDEENYCESDDNDDDKLLLPELTPLLATSIKTEQIDIEDSGPQTPPPQYVVKNEVDYEGDHCNYYPNYILGTSNDSIGDDADDEEYEMRNGIANTSNKTSSSPQRKRYVKTSLKCPKPQCEKQFYKQANLEAHIRGIHEGHEKPFQCQECSKEFRRLNKLNEHLESHMLQSEVCGLEGCDAAFKLKKTLETHRKLMHQTDGNPLSFALIETMELHQAQLSREIVMDHLCHECYKKFSSKRALTEHLKRHAQIKEHVCKVCGVAKVTRTELQTHMRTHDASLEKFNCELCPQKFNHKNAISRHVRVVHEGQRRYACSFCSKRFGTRNSQVCHERLHTGERPFSCEICVKSFAQVEGLKSHMKNHDKMLRKFVCQFCSLRFITRKNLVDHEQRHRGDKPHICNVCSRGYFKLEDLVTHRQLHIDGKTEAEGDAGEASDGDQVDFPSSQSSN